MTNPCKAKMADALTRLPSVPLAIGPAICPVNNKLRDSPIRNPNWSEADERVIVKNTDWISALEAKPCKMRSGISQLTLGTAVCSIIATPHKTAATT